MRNKDGKELIGSFDVSRIRNGRVEYGSLENWTLLRSAVCRCCGETMPKGTKTLSFGFDFSGGGSWTATKVYIHAEPCEPAKNPAAVALGSLGGKSTSEAKRKASAENGRKGGRPKKTK
jgi:hypothetical protein